MSEVLELTPAELEIIRIKREKEALIQAEKQANIQAKLERDIVTCKAEVAKIIKAQDEQIAAATEYHKQLGKGWQLNIGENENEKTVLDYYSGNKDENGHYKVIHRETFTRKEACIVNGKFTVKVKVQVVYGSQWDVRGTSNGWKMYLSGPGLDYKYERKALTKADTINKKIKEVCDAHEAKLNSAKRQINAVADTVAKMQELYPDAEVIASKSWRKESYEKYGSAIDVVKIKMANGVTSLWKVYNDGSLSRLEVNFSASTSWEVLGLLNSIKK